MDALAAGLTSFPAGTVEQNTRLHAEEHLPHHLLAERMSYLVAREQQFLNNGAAIFERDEPGSAELAAGEYRAGEEAVALREIEDLQSLFERFSADAFRPAGAKAEKPKPHHADR